MIHDSCAPQLFSSLLSLMVFQVAVASLCTPKQSFHFHLHDFRAKRNQCEKTNCDLLFMAHVVSNGQLSYQINGRDHLYLDNGDNAHVMRKSAVNSFNHTFREGVDKIKLMVQFIDEDTVFTEKQARNMFKNSAGGIGPNDKGDAVYESIHQYGTSTKSCEPETEFAPLKHGVLSAPGKVKHPGGIAYSFCVKITNIECRPITMSTSTPSVPSSSSTMTSTTKTQVTSASTSTPSSKFRRLKTNFSSADTMTSAFSQNTSEHIHGTTVSTSASADNRKLVTHPGIIALGVILFVATGIAVILVAHHIQTKHKKARDAKRRAMSMVMHMQNAVPAYRLTNTSFSFFS